jgi:hypothetical protein
MSNSSGSRFTQGQMDRLLYEDSGGSVYEADAGRMFPLNRRGLRLSDQRGAMPTLEQLVAEVGQLTRVTELRILEKRIEAVETALYDANLF